MVYPLALKFDLVTLTFDLWPWKSIGFPILLRTKYVPSLVKIHWWMLILECSQGCYALSNLTRWPWKSKGSRFSSGKISVHLERVAHHIRERLDEIKRREIDRLRILAREKMKTMNGMDVFHYISIHGGMNLIFRLILLLQPLYAS
jgi:hypothetical protein